MKEDNKKGSGLIGLMIKGTVAFSAFQMFMTGAGYDQICVAQSKDTVNCVQTSKMEKYLTSAGISGLDLPEADFELSDGESAALLICQGGDYFPIGVNERYRIETGGEGSAYSVGEVPAPCVPPKAPKNVKRYYGPSQGAGGSFCNGRTSTDNCKDCCTTIAIAQAGMVAAAGKLYRDTKPDPRGLIFDAVIESASYGLIYANRYQCNDNCEVGYDKEERISE